MALYREFTGDDVISDVAVVTSGVFQDGASKITTFFNSTVQSGSTGDYSQQRCTDNLII